MNLGLFRECNDFDIVLRRVYHYKPPNVPNKLARMALVKQLKKKHKLVRGTFDKDRKTWGVYISVKRDQYDSEVEEQTKLSNQLYKETPMFYGRMCCLTVVQLRELADLIDKSDPSLNVKNYVIDFRSHQMVIAGIVKAMKLAPNVHESLALVKECYKVFTRKG